MRTKLILAGAVSAILVATPALAVGMFDLAKTVLGGKSVLKTAEQKCGSALALNQQDNTTIDFAVAAAKKAIPQAQFLSLDSQSNAQAAQQSQQTGFCDNTKKSKKGILGKIGDAGKKLIRGKIGL
ncbi:MAG: hypothetical protein RIS52_1149 [Pseudomonadota bacterium]|jgi:hypothetical protein